MLVPRGDPASEEKAHHAEGSSKNKENYNRRRVEFSQAEHPPGACQGALKELEGREESVSKGAREKAGEGLWVRTRESGGGLSERGKGGLLHSQLVELGQLLKEVTGRDRITKRLLLQDRSPRNQVNQK